MYVREEKVRRGENEYSYWQVVEAYRADGKARQHVVAHLGPLPHRLAANVVARMAGHLCGEHKCTNEPTSEHEAYYAKRKGSKVRPLKLCEHHVVELTSGAKVMSVEYDPEKAKWLIESHRKPPAGGRPKVVPSIASREPVRWG